MLSLPTYRFKFTIYVNIVLYVSLHSDFCLVWFSLFSFYGLLYKVHCQYFVSAFAIILKRSSPYHPSFYLIVTF